MLFSKGYEMMKLNERMAFMLMQMGATPDLLGFRYVKECVVFALKKHLIIKGLIKDVYSCVAKENGITVENVERSIRHVIDVIWDNEKVDVVNECFGTTTYSKWNKPTCGQFVMTIAEILSHEFYFQDDTLVMVNKKENENSDK